MSRRRIAPLILAILMLPAASAENPSSPLEPFFGTWRVDFERSFEFVLGHQDTLGVDSLQFRGYLTQMSKIVQFVVGDSTMSLQRGRHIQEFPYRITSTGEEGVRVATETLRNNYELILRFDEDGYLRVRSSRPDFREFFIYRRAAPGETLQVQSPFEAGRD